MSLVLERPPTKQRNKKKKKKEQQHAQLAVEEEQEQVQVQQSEVVEQSSLADASLQSEPVVEPVSSVEAADSWSSATVSAPAQDIEASSFPPASISIVAEPVNIDEGQSSSVIEQPRDVQRDANAALGLSAAVSSSAPVLDAQAEAEPVVQEVPPSEAEVGESAVVSSPTHPAPVTIDASSSSSSSSILLPPVGVQHEPAYPTLEPEVQSPPITRVDESQVGIDVTSISLHQVVEAEEEAEPGGEETIAEEKEEEEIKEQAEEHIEGEQEGSSVILAAPEQAQSQMDPMSAIAPPTVMPVSARQPSSSYAPPPTALLAAEAQEQAPTQAPPSYAPPAYAPAQPQIIQPPMQQAAPPTHISAQQQQQLHQHSVVIQEASQQLAQPLQQSIPLSVPSLLENQMHERTVSNLRPPSSVLGRLQSDIIAASLHQRHDTNARAFSQWFERKAAALRGRFYDLLEQFRQAHFQLSATRHAAQDASVAALLQLQCLWQLRMQKQEQRGMCGDGVTLEHKVTYAVAEFDQRQAEQAYAKLANLQSLAMQDLTSRRFLSQSAMLQIELYLHELMRGPMQSAGGVQHEGEIDSTDTSDAPLSSSSSSSASPSPAARPSLEFMHHLRYCLDVLFFFEKFVDPEHEQQRRVWRVRARERQEHRQAVKVRLKSMTEAAAQQTLPPNLDPAAAQQAAAVEPKLLVDDEEVELTDEQVEELCTDSSDLSSSSSNPSSPSPSSIPFGAREDSQFRRSVRKWIRIVVDALFKFGSYNDHQYVLCQVLRCRGITRWGSFVQFKRANENEARANPAQISLDTNDMSAAQPSQAVRDAAGWLWSDAFVQHILASLTLLLTPIPGKQLKFNTAPSPGVSPTASLSAQSQLERVMIGGGGVSNIGEWHLEPRAEDGERVVVRHGEDGNGDDTRPSMDDSSTESAEWIVLDETRVRNAFNTDVSYNFSLNESDYCELLQRIPLLPLVRSRVYPIFLNLARRHLDMHRHRRHHHRAPGMNQQQGQQPGEHENAYDAYDRQCLSQAMGEVKCAVQLLSAALNRFPEYSHLNKLIAKSLTSIVALLGEAWKQAWMDAKRQQDTMEMEGKVDDELNKDKGVDAAAADHSALSTPVGLHPYPCCHACHSFYSLLQKDVDFCILRLICSMQHCSSNVLFFLSDLPFHMLSSEAAGQALLCMLNQSMPTDYNDSSLAFTPLLLTNWLHYLATPSGANTRERFQALLLNGKGDYVHVLMGATKLCKQPYELSPCIIPPLQRTSKHKQHRRNSHDATPPSYDQEQMQMQDVENDSSQSKNGFNFRPTITDLPLILLNELFHCSYINLTTREELFRPCQPYILSLCAAHPLAISFLLFLCHHYWRFIGPAAVALFDDLDLSSWRPAAGDMYILQSLLLAPPKSHGCELARNVLLRLPYDYLLTTQPTAEQSRNSHSAPRPAQPDPLIRPEHLFFPPRPRTPLLGWQFHRALLLMLADVRLAQLRPTPPPSSASTSTASQTVPFTAFINFPTCTWSHTLRSASAHASRANSRRNSGAGAVGASNPVPPPMPPNSSHSVLPQPPPVEQHLQAQFNQRQLLLGQQPVGGANLPPPSSSLPSSTTTPDGHSYLYASQSAVSGLGALLSPAATALADVWSGFTISRPSDPQWWLRILSLLQVRDAGGEAPLPPVRAWISTRFSVSDTELDELTSIVKTDPVLVYIQLSISWLGAEPQAFVREGWSMIRNALLNHAQWAPLGWRLLHDLLPPLMRSTLSHPHLHSPSLSLSPSWSMMLAPPSLPTQKQGPMQAEPNLAPSSSAAVAAPPIPPRPSQSSSVPPSFNPYMTQSSHSSNGRSNGSSSSTNSFGLPLIQQINLVRHLLDQARPKGVSALFSSKNTTFDIIHTLAYIMAGQMLTRMRAQDPDPSSLRSLFVYWCEEIVHGLVKEHWSRDHNLRVLFDALCRVILVFRDSFSGGEPAQIAQPLSHETRLLFSFIGEQALSACAAAGVKGVHGLERKDGVYLERCGPATFSGQPSGSANVDVQSIDEIEIQFDFSPYQRPPKHIIDALLPPESLVLSFGLPAKECIVRYPFATFASLLEETMADRTAWLRLGHIIVRCDHKAPLKASLKRLGIGDDRIRRSSMLRRWIQFALACPPDHPLLPLYWQMVCRLMFARLHLSQPAQNNMGGYFGFRMVQGTSGKQIMHQIQEHIASLEQYFSQRRMEAINRSNGAPLHPSVYALPQLFHAMSAWLGVDINTGALGHLNSLRERLLGFGVALPDKFAPQRLRSILIPPTSVTTPLWLDLVDMARLRWVDVQQLQQFVHGADAVLSAAKFDALQPSSMELQMYRFYYDYYTSQSYDLPEYAPSPRRILALIKRKPITANDNSSRLTNKQLSEIDARSVFGASEYADGGIGSGGYYARVASAASGLHRRRSELMSVSPVAWMASLTGPPSPPPVLGMGAMQGDLSTSKLHIPSVLMGGVWELLHHPAMVLSVVQSSIRSFSDRHSHVLALDRQLSDLCPLLYRNEQTDYSYTKPCRVAWSGSSRCRSPVSFVFRYTRAVRLRAVEDDIHANRQQAMLRMDAAKSPAILDEIGLPFCAALIAVHRLTRRILACAPAGTLMPMPSTSPGEGQVDGEMDGEQQRVVRAGVDWLFALAALEGPVTALFPPAHFFLHGAITSLTPLLTHPLVHTVALQQSLLELLRQHTPLINTLSAACKPLVSKSSDEFLHLFRLAITVRDEYGITSTQIMRNFDVRTWLQSEPTPSLLARQQLFALCSQQLREEERQPRRRPGASPPAQVLAASDALCQLYAEMLLDLARSDISELFILLMRTVLEDTKSFAVNGSPMIPTSSAGVPSPSSPSSMPDSSMSDFEPLHSPDSDIDAPPLSTARAPKWLHRMWRELSSLPIHHLTWTHMTRTVEMIEQHLWESRRAHTAQVAQMTGPSQQQGGLAGMIPITQSNVRVLSLLGDLLPSILHFYRSFVTAMHPTMHPPAALDSDANTAISSASSMAKKDAAWQCLWQCFSAFCAPDPPPVTVSVCGTKPPSKLTHPWLDGQLQLMIDYFISVIAILQSCGREEDGFIMDKFWHCYTQQITVAADTNFLRKLHHTFIEHTMPPMDPSAPMRNANSSAPDGIPIRPLPFPALLTLHRCWRLSVGHLQSFQSTLRQVIDLHEREVQTVMSVEKSRREAEYAQQAQLAKGVARREAKLQPLQPVRRRDVKMMCENGVKVELVATFISHLISASDWSYSLQQQAHGDHDVRHPMRGLYRPAFAHRVDEIYTASSCSDYAATLLLTALHIATECPPPTAMSMNDGQSPLLPSFNRLLTLLTHLDWSSIMMVRVPAPTPTHHGGMRDMSMSMGMNMSMGQSGEHGMGAPLASEHVLQSIGSGAIEREIQSTQSLLESISAILYAERHVDRVMAEMEADAASHAALSAPSTPHVKSSTMASLLSAPLAALVSSDPIQQNLTRQHPSRPSQQLSISHLSPRPPQSPPLPDMDGDADQPTLTHEDVYGLIRPHINVETGEAKVRYVENIMTSGESKLHSAVQRTFHVFAIMYRLCSPLPPTHYCLQPQSSAARTPFFVPSVLAMRRCRLYTEWLLSIYSHGDDAPRPLMPDACYLSLAQWLLRDLDHYHSYMHATWQPNPMDRGGNDSGHALFDVASETIPILQEWMFVANLQSRGIQLQPAVQALTNLLFHTQSIPLSLLTITAACRSIVAVDQLAAYIERSMETWMDERMGINGQHGVDPSSFLPPSFRWHRCSLQLEIPDLSFDEFVLACLQQGAILTLHAVAIKLLRAGAGESADENRRLMAVDGCGTHQHMHLRCPHPPAVSARPLFKRVDTLLQWISKAHVKDLKQSGDHHGKKPKNTTLSPSSSASLSSPSSSSSSSSSSFPRRSLASLYPADAEALKLLVALRSLLEWQGAMVEAFLTQRGECVGRTSEYSSMQGHGYASNESPPSPLSPLSPHRHCHAASLAHAHYSHPLLAHLRLQSPDPFPLLASADSLLDGVQRLLLRLLHESGSGSGGFMSFIGLSSHHKYSTRFRLLLRAFHTAILCYVTHNAMDTARALAMGNVKPNKAKPLTFEWGRSSGASVGTGMVVGGAVSADVRSLLIGAFNKDVSSKTYADLQHQSRLLTSVITQATDPSKYHASNPAAASSTFVPLVHLHKLLDQCIAAVYPEFA